MTHIENSKIAICIDKINIVTFKTNIFTLGSITRGLRKHVSICLTIIVTRQKK